MGVNADLIFFIRKRKLKLGRKRLFEISGVHDDTIRKLEEGVTESPHTKTLQALAKAFTDAGYPIGWKDLMDDDNSGDATAPTQPPVAQAQAS